VATYGNIKNDFLYLIYKIMKYIKSFNESNNVPSWSKILNIVNPTLQNLKDILLEIEDIGYYTNVYTLYSCDTFFDIQIDITKDYDSLNEFIDANDDIEVMDISEIWETLERILDYSKSNGLKESFYDINDVSIKTHRLKSINDINTYNLKKLSIFLTFNI
jgi:hypothetical protein